MARPKKNNSNSPPAARATTAGPYTHRSNGNSGGRRGIVNNLESSEFAALDRKLTDGLNLTHHRIEVSRQEFREDHKQLRQELAEDRKERREEQKQLRADMDARFDKVDARLDKVDARLETMDASLRELAVQGSAESARSQVIRRLVVGVLGALGGLALLAIGAVLRPALERMMAALLGG